MYFLYLGTCPRTGDRSETNTIIGKISDKLRRIARYLTNFSGDFNKIGLVAVD